MKHPWTAPPSAHPWLSTPIFSSQAPMSQSSFSFFSVFALQVSSPNSLFFSQNVLLLCFSLNLHLALFFPSPINSHQLHCLPLTTTMARWWRPLPHVSTCCSPGNRPLTPTTCYQFSQGDKKKNLWSKSGLHTS